MSDTLGNIPVPDLTISGTFPLTPAYPHGTALSPQVVVHRFGTLSAKVEQRFLIGDGARRFRLSFPDLDRTDLTALEEFWEDTHGGSTAFYYNAPDNADGDTTQYVCRFDNTPLSVEMLATALASSEIELIEIPQSPPSYTVSSTVTRFPSSTLKTALLSQVQEIIPLVTISPCETDYPVLYVSDRRCTIDDQLYQARVLSIDGISQTTRGGADQVTIKLGNADRVMRALVNDTSLDRAKITVSLYHVGSTILLNLWTGYVTSWTLDESPEFTLQASDGFYELSLVYPPRRFSRTCWKKFDDGSNCPYSSQGSGGDTSFCDKTYNGTDGCSSHGMNRYFGGVWVSSSSVNIKDNSTGVWGFRRSPVTSTSIRSQTIYEQVLKEIYTDEDFMLNLDIAAGREESDFYDAIGVAGAGPIGAFTPPGNYLSADGSQHYRGPYLDEQTHHGFGTSQPSYGLRSALGTDPAGVSDQIVLTSGQSGETLESCYAAGVAFQEVRRSDAKGQGAPSALTAHSMSTWVREGMSGWVWTGAGSRSWEVLSNPIWICVNMILRSRGLQSSSATICEQYFDVTACVAAAAVCDTLVEPIYPRTTATEVAETGHEDQYLGWVVDTPASIEYTEITEEKQFKFRGVIGEEKSLRDWLQEILNNCCGGYTVANGKFKPFIRSNSSVVEAFTVGNILFESLQLSPRAPEFTSLTAVFADEEYDYSSSYPVTLYDETYEELIAGGSGSIRKKNNINLCGTTSKSQAARIVISRLREELGGISAAEWKAARRGSFKTTVLALNTEPGMVCSLDHDDMPNGSGEFRVTSWRLNPDYSIDVEWTTTTDSMYDMTEGPKPVDVEPDPLPVQMAQVPLGLVWHPYNEQPPTDDPLLSTDDWTFGLEQEYVTQADGTMRVNALVRAEMPVTSFIAGVDSPRIRHALTSETGGSLPGGGICHFSVSAYDSSGNLTPPSNIQTVTIPGTTPTGSVTLYDISWPAGTYSGYILYASISHQQLLCRQETVAGSLPESIRFAGPILRSTQGLPSSKTVKARLRAKWVVHSGPIGALITSIDESNRLVCLGMKDTTDNWAGRYITVIADASDGSAPIWNFEIVSNTNTDDGMAFEVTPNPTTAGVEVNDILIIRAKASDIGTDSITDPLWQNDIYPTGMVPDAEIGNLLRVIAGHGRGTVRRIIDNDATTIWVDTPWDKDDPPDTDSVFIVESPSWAFVSEADICPTSVYGVTGAFRIPVDNLLGGVVLIQGTLVDDYGYESPDSLSPVREIYLFGSQIIKTITEDYTVERTDGVLLCDTSLAPITIQLPSGAVMPNQNLTIVKVSDESPDNPITVVPETGELISGAPYYEITLQWQCLTIKGDSNA